jgi:ParB/RepB/Spo0J family partition protein
MKVTKALALAIFNYTKTTVMTTQTTMQFATDDHVKKLGLFYVPFHKLKILEDFNDRQDYGTTEEMNELAESIYQVGPKVPLKGYKDGEFYVVIVGHRRHRAGEMIMKKYKKNIIFQVQVYAPGTKKKDMLLDTLLTNSGKDLTPLEKASTVSKLLEEKVTTRDVAASLGGVSEVYVKNLQRLWGVPDEAKKLIREGVVSATYVMSILKTKGADIEKFIQEVTEQANSNGQDKSKGKGKKKKQAKVTAKKGPKTKNSENSLKHFKQFRKWLQAKTDQDRPVAMTKQKQEIFDTICMIQDNGMSYDAIVKFFVTVKS